MQLHCAAAHRHALGGNGARAGGGGRDAVAPELVAASEAVGPEFVAASEAVATAPARTTAHAGGSGRNAVGHLGRRRWGRVIAGLLRPGGRVFVRDLHPVLASAMAVTVRDHEPDRDQAPHVSGPGDRTVALEHSYWQQDEPQEWTDEHSYAGDGVVTSPRSLEWNHALSEIVMAALDAGLVLETLVEHDSVPWEALPGEMTSDEHGEFQLMSRPERLPASFTMIARKPTSS